jgi:hypothetical protein
MSGFRRKADVLVEPAEGLLLATGGRPRFVTNGQMEQRFDQLNDLRRIAMPHRSYYRI